MSLSQPQANRRDERLGETSVSPADANAMSDRGVTKGFPLAFGIWERDECCPHCGSEDIEYDLGLDRAVCCWCGAYSADVLVDELETRLINDLDRFDYLDIFEQDRVGE